MDFIFDPSLVLYLPLYELDGASFMSKDAYGHLCTVTGALWTSQGRDFDGIDDSITLPTAFDSLTDLTLEAWLLCNNAAVDYHPFGFYKDDNNRFVPYFHPANGITNVIVVGGNAYDVVSNDIAVEGQWYHIACLLGTGGMLLYVDGVLQTDTDANTLSFADLGGMTEVTFGKWKVADAAHPWDGYIGEVRLYNRRLTPLEVQHNYLATKWRYQK